RDTIASAAHAEALAASATDLLRRLTDAVNASSASASASASAHQAHTTDLPPSDEPSTEGASDMPSRVETLIALGRVPLLAALTTRQLADVAERARWIHLRAGGVLVTAGDLLDALVVVEDGELAIGDRRFTRGEVVDELACVAPSAVADDLRAIRPARLIRLERMDFEELVDDVPGLASAVCRALGERARRAEDSNYRSPLVSRAS
ncbi:MAG: cyclic nucleotide-binding domain-containing protein, partial [Myxococcota bacterium]|nr:cyclic nucleotide-binding domain-containing protein [Myxococcota bacterium]